MPTARLTPRTLLFRLHWALGLTAGLVLALMGLTGALLSYEEAVTASANRDRIVVAPAGRTPLLPAALAARVEAQAPGLKAGALTLSGDPAASVHVRFARDPATGHRPPSIYADPYDGTVLGPVRLEEAFGTVRALHRWLLIPGEGRGWGRTVTGACALALIAFLATGLYLRWPQVHRWRIWLRPSLSRPGRARWWSLHAVLGTWLAPAYLVMALSGLTWSYDWFKDGATRLLVGAPAAKGDAAKGDPARGARPMREAGRPGPAPGGAAPALDRAWTAFREGPGRGAGLAILTLPGPDAKAIRIRWLAQADDPLKTRSEARYDAASGAPLAAERAADMTLGRQIAENMLEVHRGRFFGDLFALVFCLAALAMPGFAATGLTLYVLRRRSAARRKGASAGTSAPVRPAPAPAEA